jgi:hypothetical protein
MGKYLSFDIFSDKYSIFKFKRVNIQIGMCWGVYTQFYHTYIYIYIESGYDATRSTDSRCDTRSVAIHFISRFADCDEVADDVKIDGAVLSLR